MGTRAGRKNRRTAEVEEIFARYNFDPLVRLIKTSVDPDLAPELRIKILCELMHYLYPKRKAVEHSGAIATQGGVVYIPTPLHEDDWDEAVAAYQKEMDQYQSHPLVKDGSNGHSLN